MEKIEKGSGGGGARNTTRRAAGWRPMNYEVKYSDC